MRLQYANKSSKVRQAKRNNVVEFESREKVDVIEHITKNLKDIKWIKHVKIIRLPTLKKKVAQVSE